MVLKFRCTLSQCPELMQTYHAKSYTTFNLKRRLEGVYLGIMGKDIDKQG